MYKRLLDYKFKYVQLFQRHLGSGFKGKILDVDAESLVLQSYDAEGNEVAQFIVALSTITDVLVAHPELDKLALKVQYAASAPIESDSPEDIPDDLIVSL